MILISQSWIVMVEQYNNIDGDCSPCVKSLMDMELLL
jgi:hypothetical protein